MSRTKTDATLDHVIGLDGLLSIRLRDGDVRIRAVDGEAVRIRDRGGDNVELTFAVELAEGSASLSATGEIDAGGRHRRGGSPDIEIEAPRRATILIESTNADITVDGLLGDQRYRTTSGDVTLRGAAGRIDIEAVSGDVDIIATDDAEVALRTVSGDVGLRAATMRSLAVATTSGDVKIAGRPAGPGPFGIETVSGDGLFAPAGDLTIEMTTMSGDLHSEIDATAQGGRGRRMLVIGRGGPLVTFRSMSGDLHVVRATAVPPPVTANATANPAPAAATPADPTPATPQSVPATHVALARAYEDARLRILRSLERGEIDVTEAGRRLEALDEADPGADAAGGLADRDARADG